MIQLTADLSEPLLQLIHQDTGIVDGVEVGPWYLPDEVHWYCQRLPELGFFFHGADLVNNVGWRLGAIGEIQAYLNASDSPWISLHLSAWLTRWMRGFLQRGWPVPKPNPDWDARRLVWQIQRVARAVNVPLLLENVDPLPWPGYGYYAEPAWIKRILDQTGCALLLDTGHARVTAAAFGMDVIDYINQLPLDRVVQVHASGPRVTDGRLYDAHEPLQEEDYSLLATVLQKSHPEVITLEYIRDPAALLSQINRLREIMYGSV